MMGALKSPTMKRQDRQTRNATKRGPSPNETRPHTLGIGPKPQNARIAKSKAAAVHNVLKNISYLPLMFGDEPPPAPATSAAREAAASRRSTCSTLSICSPCACWWGSPLFSSKEVLTQDSIEMHFLRYSLERMNAPVLEAQARASHEITHCARHHRFARLRFRRNASRNVYGNSSDVVALHLDFASMQTAAYSDAKWSHR